MNGSSEPVVLTTAGVQQRIVTQLAERYPMVGPVPIPLAEYAAQLSTGAIARVRVLVTLGSSPTSASAMRALPQLGLICCTGTGYEGVDLLAARESGIVVTHSPGVTAGSVADVAVGLAIASVRKMWDASVTLRTRGPAKPWPAAYGLTGRRIGIFGLGAIGEKVASRLAGFEVEVGYHSRRPRPQLPYQQFDSLLALAEWADVLIVCVPASAATEHAVDAKVIAALGPNGHLVNIGRGSVVDTAALCDALERETIAGAALDVFEPSYLPRLARLRNATLTPHIGGATEQAERAMCELVLRNIDAFLSGAQLPTPVPVPPLSAESVRHSSCKALV